MLPIYLKSAPFFVRFLGYIILMQVARGERIACERVGTVLIDGFCLNKWRFGRSHATFVKALRKLDAEGWYPDVIYVDCFTTFWWEGAAEAIQRAKAQFPDAQTILTGSYAALAPTHARTHTAADEVIAMPRPDLFNYAADISLYSPLPSFLYLSTGNGSRSVEQIADEIADAVKASRRRLRSFAFVEHTPIARFGDLYCSLLETLIKRELDVTLYALVGQC